MVPHGLSPRRTHATLLLGLPVLAGALAYGWFLAMRLGAGETLSAALLIVLAGVYGFALLLPAMAVLLPLVAFLVILKALVEMLVEMFVEMLANARDGAVGAYHGWHNSGLAGLWSRTAMYVFPPALAESFLNDVCHHREQMAGEGYRQMTIELSTAWIYGQAFVGWLFNIVLRLLTIPVPKPKD